MIRACVVFALITAAAPAFAQEGGRVGAISFAYIARSSQAGKAALAAIEKVVKDKEAEAAVKAAALQKLRLEVPATLFEKSRVEFERFQQDARAEIEALQQKFDAEFRIKLNPIVDAISKERGLHFVFGLEQAAIVWWSPAVDISEEVVKRLDAGKP
jgi:Skp family chaperone for outer membrane proteins